MTSTSIERINEIEQSILMIRGEKVILDTDLAKFYGVATKRLNEQVKRNKSRFPKDFLFQLTSQEKSEVVAKCDHLANLKYSKTAPFAFTEHGALMAASVLNTNRAVEMSVFVVRGFVRLRQAFAGQKELTAKLGQLELKVSKHDKQILSLIQAIKQLMGLEPVSKKRRIGF